MNRGHKLINKAPETHPDFIFTTRNDAEFGIICRGARAGMFLMPKNFSDIQHDCNIHFIKGVKPFETNKTFMSAAIPMLNATEIVMHYEITKNARS